MTTTEIRSLNRWLTVGGTIAAISATATIGLLTWMANSINNLSHEVVAIRTELDLAQPSEVLKAVRDSDSKRLRREDVEQIVSKTAPWPDEKPDWMSWRREVTDRLIRLEIDAFPNQPRPLVHNRGD